MPIEVATLIGRQVYTDRDWSVLGSQLEERKYGGARSQGDIAPLESLSVHCSSLHALCPFTVQ
jgi:hypothetical protein